MMNKINTIEQSEKLFLDLEQKCENRELIIFNPSFNSSSYETFQDLVNAFIELNYSESSFTILTDSINGNDSTRFCKNRSLEDLYRIVINYFPKTRILDLAKYLVEGNFEYYPCTNIQKIVFIKKGFRGYGFKSLDDMTEEIERWESNIQYKDFKPLDNIYPEDYKNLL